MTEQKNHRMVVWVMLFLMITLKYVIVSAQRIEYGSDYIRMVLSEYKKKRPFEFIKDGKIFKAQLTDDEIISYYRFDDDAYSVNVESKYGRVLGILRNDSKGVTDIFDGFIPPPYALSLEERNGVLNVVITSIKYGDSTLAGIRVPVGTFSIPAPYKELAELVLKDAEYVSDVTQNIKTTPDTTQNVEFGSDFVKTALKKYKEQKSVEYTKIKQGLEAAIEDGQYKILYTINDFGDPTISMISKGRFFAVSFNDQGVVSIAEGYTIKPMYFFELQDHDGLLCARLYPRNFSGRRFDGVMLPLGEYSIPQPYKEIADLISRDIKKEQN